MTSKLNDNTGDTLLPQNFTTPAWSVRLVDEDRRLHDWILCSR